MLRRKLIAFHWHLRLILASKFSKKTFSASATSLLIQSCTSQLVSKICVVLDQPKKAHANLLLPTRENVPEMEFVLIGDAEPSAQWNGEESFVIIKKMLNFNCFVLQQLCTVCLQPMWLLRDMQDSWRQGQNDQIINGAQESGEYCETEIDLWNSTTRRLLLS